MIAPTLTPDLRADLAGLRYRLLAELHRESRIRMDMQNSGPAELFRAVEDHQIAYLNFLVAIGRAEQGLAK